MFDKRCYDKELLDAESIDTIALHRNLYELGIVNSWLGGHAISISGIKKLLLKLNKSSLKIIDVGCGGGDNLRAISKYFKYSGTTVCLTGADLKQDCIDYARKKSLDYPDIDFVCDDFRNVLTNQIDIVHAALFFHHFSEQEIAHFLSLAHRRGCYIVINDLERNPIACYAIAILTKLFSKSYLVKNDAPLSVRRGFKKQEWKAIMTMAGIENYTITNRWAFRHLIITYPHGK